MPVEHLSFCGTVDIFSWKRFLCDSILQTNAQQSYPSQECKMSISRQVRQTENRHKMMQNVCCDD